jgi:hypothetical protein
VNTHREQAAVWSISACATHSRCAAQNDRDFEVLSRSIRQLHRSELPPEAAPVRQAAGILRPMPRYTAIDWLIWGIPIVAGVAPLLWPNKVLAWTILALALLPACLTWVKKNYWLQQIQRRKPPSSSNVVDMQPDWPFRELVFHLDPSLRTGPSDPQTAFRDIRAHLTSGNLRAWGKEGVRETAFPLVAIAPEYWHNALPNWAPILQPERAWAPIYAERAREPHVVRIPRNERYWALHVNKSQALKIWPMVYPDDYTINELVRHVAKLIKDDGPAFYGSRKVIRERAASGKITLRGYRQLDVKIFDTARTPIPAAYWKDYEINITVAEPVGAGMKTSQTRRIYRKPGDPEDTGGYADMVVSREEMFKVWAWVITCRPVPTPLDQPPTQVRPGARVRFS